MKIIIDKGKWTVMDKGDIYAFDTATEAYNKVDELNKEKLRQMCDDDKRTG